MAVSKHLYKKAPYEVGTSYAFNFLAIRVLCKKNETGFFKLCDNINDNYADKYTYA